MLRVKRKKACAWPATKAEKGLKQIVLAVEMTSTLLGAARRCVERYGTAPRAPAAGVDGEGPVLEPSSLEWRRRNRNGC